MAKRVSKELDGSSELVREGQVCSLATLDGVDM